MFKEKEDGPEEAQRDGAIAIDLIDGIQLAEKLRDLKLGVSIRTVEEVQINKEWFDSF